MPSGPVLESRCFDGERPAALPVRLWVQDGRLHVQGEGFERVEPVAALRWPERQRHGARQLMLPGQGIVEHADGPGWDAWARASGLQEGRVVHWQQSWRRVGIALVLCVLALGAGWRWGVPLAAEGIAAVLPAAVEVEIGDRMLAALDQAGLAPSTLPPARQARIRQAFEAALRADDHPPPAWTLHFRASGRLALGPNALALPGGPIVLTDGLVALLDDAPDVLTGVLAHELGHLRHRHGLQAIVQAGLLGALAAVVLGDVSSVLATAPVLLGQAAYARDAEREADAEAARVLRAAGLAPRRMVLLFERLQAWRDAQPEGRRFEPPIAFASHPADAERIRYFESAQVDPVR